MSILSLILSAVEPGPNRAAVAAGLSVRRTGWGRYTYSGRPDYARTWVRRPADELDRAICAAAGMLGAWCPECRTWDPAALTPTRCQSCIETPGWYLPARMTSTSSTPTSSTPTAVDRPRARSARQHRR